MKKNSFIRSLLLPWVFVLVFAQISSTAADVFGKTAPVRSVQGAQIVRMSNPTLSVSADALLHKLRQNQPITLVDIRSPEEFDKSRIPGSINIPLYAIKTKAFLKSVPFVLVEDGYRYKSLESQCRNLRDEGFEASFLIGGLNAWKHRGGPLQKEVFELKTFNRISPQAFYQEKNYEEWIVINASTEQTPASMELFPNALHIPVIDGAGNVAINLKKKTGPGRSRLSCPLMIFNEDGNQYRKIEKIIEKAGLLNAFYLEGGLRAYDEFLNHLALSRKPRDERLKTSRACGACQRGKSQEAKNQDK
jgi:rhodanese-related sulfurtransferase